MPLIDEMVCQPELSVSDVQWEGEYIKTSECSLIYIAIALKAAFISEGNSQIDLLSIL